MNPRRKFRARALALAGVVSLGLSAAATTVRADGLPAATNLAALKQKYRRPAAIPFPADNSYSDAKAELGQTLFFDPRLSGAGTMSCGTCHNPALTWKDGLPRGVGHDAKQLGRATPTILNLAWADLLMWDGRKNGLEDQATGPIGSPAEMNQPLEQLVPKLSGVAGYHSAFAKAFGSDEITVPKIAQAIATFERTVVSNKSPFDLWIEGNETAISDGAKRGFQLFNTKANCAACHSGWRFTDDGFHDIGLPSEDPGRAAQVPDEPTLQHAFKTPTLRNISARAPYMHDGSVATLDAVLVHYDSGFVSRPSLSPEMHRLGLTAAKRADLLAFLQSLTSKDDLITMPQLPVREVSQ